MRERRPRPRFSEVPYFLEIFMGVSDIMHLRAFGSIHRYACFIRLFLAILRHFAYSAPKSVEPSKSSGTVRIGAAIAKIGHGLTNRTRIGDLGPKPNSNMKVFALPPCGASLARIFWTLAIQDKMSKLSAGVLSQTILSGKFCGFALWEMSANVHGLPKT